MNEKYRDGKWTVIKPMNDSYGVYHATNGKVVTNFVVDRVEPHPERTRIVEGHLTEIEEDIDEYGSTRSLIRIPD